MTKEQAIQLAEKIATGSYSKMELDSFLEFLRFSPPEETSRILDEFLGALDQQRDQQLYVGPDFMERLRQLRPVEMSDMTNAGTARENKRFSFARVAAAAAVIIALGAGGYFYFSHAPKSTPAKQTNQAMAHDIAAPNSNRASITLASGQKVFLDSAAKGTLAVQGNVKVEKLADGEIRYNGNEQPKIELVYNTIFNPRGSKVIDVTLSDGTRVWLNAESSLKYPVAFNGQERKVEITGEAYFEVRHDAKMPFRVKAANELIEDIGTHFNINSYADEFSVNTTLLEGAVKVNNVLLKPGQQAKVVGSNIKIVDGADIEKVMAWKNGFFAFSNADISTVMRQLSRWYDVDVKYESKLDAGYFTGEIGSGLTLAQVMKGLASTVHFKIEGKTITMMK